MGDKIYNTSQKDLRQREIRKVVVKVRERPGGDKTTLHRKRVELCTEVIWSAYGHQGNAIDLFFSPPDIPR